MKNRFPREFYVPKGTIKVADKLSNAVAYVYERAGAAYALGFHGKADKPDFHHRYSTTAHREAAVLRHFEACRASEARQAQRRAERKAFVPTFQVGDVLNTCWGYDQTNVEYFEITEVRGKHVILRQVGCEAVATGWAQERTVPMIGSYVGKPIRRLAQKGGVRISSCQWASPTSFKEMGGLRVFNSSHTSSYA